MAETFGAAFGRLVKAKRGKEWTQSSLAAAMFPDQEDAGEKRKGDISKLENGKVANPDAKTISRIAEVLGITDAEIDALRKQVQMSPQEQLDAVPSLSRNQLELLASRFELERAFDKSDAELRGFLNNKAEEYRSYKAEIEAIDERTRGLGNLKAAARAAAVDLNFEEVETLLSMVQEAELEGAAETAELRARNALMRGRAEQAYTLLSAAADSFAGFNPIETAQRRHKYAVLLGRFGFRNGGASLFLSISFFDSSIKIYEDKGLLEDRAKVVQDRANALSNQGRRAVGDESVRLFHRALKGFDDALNVRTEVEHPSDWAMTTQNKAYTLMELGRRTKGVESANLLSRAVQGYTEALRIRTKQDDEEKWAMTMYNKAVALSKLGVRTEGRQGEELLFQAIIYFNAILRARNIICYNDSWALTTQGKAETFFYLGRRNIEVCGMFWLSFALKAYNNVLDVFTSDHHPFQWARTMQKIARCELASANYNNCTNPTPHLRTALKNVEAALTVYDPQHMPYYFDKATALRDDLKTRLAAL